MKIDISKPIVDDWTKQLKRAGPIEIGGVLFGEQLFEGSFRVVAASRQRLGNGSIDQFCRDGKEARRDILELHRSYGSEPERFNYLGEWHSHPNAPAVPSAHDEFTMAQLLADQSGAVNFLVLLIVRLSGTKRLEIGGRAYLASGHILPCEIEFEQQFEISND